MASLTWWTWVWVNSGSWWWTGRSGVLRFMGSQSRTRLSDWTELNCLPFHLSWVLSLNQVCILEPPSVHLASSLSLGSVATSSRTSTGVSILYYSKQSVNKLWICINLLGSVKGLNGVVKDTSWVPPCEWEAILKLQSLTQACICPLLDFGRIGLANKFVCYGKTRMNFLVNPITPLSHNSLLRGKSITCFPQVQADISGPNSNQEELLPEMTVVVPFSLHLQFASPIARIQKALQDYEVA